VKLVFDNKTRMLAIDFDEVTIERAVHRDSANEYFINGSQVRLKDISELLAGAHIGSSGHHIISQGEADRILNANLRERREMIEDALGLKVYHFKREESLRKLDKTEDNLNQVESLRKEIAPHIRFLEKQVEKVNKAREMRVNLESLYKDYFKREDLFIRFERSRLIEERKAPDQKLASLETELAAAKATLAQADRSDAKSAELLSHESKLHTLRVERDTLTRDVGRIEGQIASEERILRKQQELAASQDLKMVELREFENIANSVYSKLSDAEKMEDVPSLKDILKGIRELLGNFIHHHKTQTETGAAADSESEIRRLKMERDAVMARLEHLSAVEADLAKRYSALQIEIEKEKDSNRDAEKAMFRIMAEQNEAISILTGIRGEEERLSIIDSNLKRELQEGATLCGRAVLDFAAFKILNAQGWEVSDQDMLNEERAMQEERRKAIERIKFRLEDAGASGGEETLKEYQEAKERDEFLAREIEDLQKSADTLKVLIKDLEEKLNTEFKTGVEKINHQFNEFFALMFGGGSAKLDVVREEKRRRKSDTDILGEDESGEEFVEEQGQEGIDISITLPQKRIKGLMMLSGGERALTSIALLFAISQVNPPPFIILDETDAALDEANSRKYGDMIDSLSKYSQLILITHNRETMSRAGILYGVTMSSDGSSKLLSIKFDEAVAVAK
jgi:chromosome segregation protein